MVITLSPEHLKRQIEALKSLRDNEGFHALLEVIREDLQKATEQIYKAETLSDQQIDYRRGACYATSNFLTLVDRLINYYENKYILASAPRQGDQSSSR